MTNTNTAMTDIDVPAILEVPVHIIAQNTFLLQLKSYDRLS
jgi:hypothetical protein